MSHGMNKIAAERNQRALLELANQLGNDVCADCRARNPRWASHNLGIFICMSCASIHRKMGTHISKVKSLTMDTWTKEQLEVMKNMGNVKSNAYHNPDETRNPPPTNMADAERDSDLEKYIRSKYEFKTFVNRSAHAAALLGPSKSASSRLSPGPPARSQTAPVSAAPPPATLSSVPPPVPPKIPISDISASLNVPTSGVGPATLLSQSQFRSVSQPVAASPAVPHQQQQQAQTTTSYSMQIQAQSPLSGVAPSTWNTMMSLQSSSFPTTSTSQPMSISPQPAGTLAQTPSANPYSTLSASPSSPFPSSLSTGQGQLTGTSTSYFSRSMSLNTGLDLNMNMSAGSNLIPTAVNGTLPFQQPQTQSGLGLSAPSFNMNPFSTQSFTSGGMTSNFTPSSSLGQLSGGSSFQSTPPFNQGLSQPQPQPSPLFHPQPLNQPPMQAQAPSPMNPFLHQQPQISSLFGAQPQYGGIGTPSPGPFAQQQQPQQLQMQSQMPAQMGMQQPAFSPQNPFSGWQTGTQNGFAG